MKREDVQKVLDGAQVRVLRFGPDDSYQEMHTGGELYTIIGRTGRFTKPGRTFRGPEWFGGSFAFDDGGKSSYFYQAKVEVV